MNPDHPALVAPPPPDLLRTPWHRVIGVLPGLDEATSSVVDLRDAGFAGDEIYAICGEEGERRLDPFGKHHGLRGRLVRAVEIGNADDTLSAYANELTAGRVILSVPARDGAQRSTAAHVLRDHGATSMRYFGAAATTELG